MDQIHHPQTPAADSNEDQLALKELGYKTAAKILVPGFMPIWIFAAEYDEVQLSAADTTSMINAATTWAEGVKVRVQRGRAVQEVGRRTAEALLVPEWLRPTEFAEEWKQANLQSTGADTMEAAAAQWAQGWINQYTAPLKRPPEPLQQFGFRIAFPLVFEKTGLPVGKVFARFAKAALQASTSEEMEVKARAWAEATIRKLSTGA